MKSKLVRYLIKGTLCLIFSMLIILVHSSCTVTNDISYQERLISIDLSKYNQEGFFITTGDLFGNYTSISIVQVYCRSGIMNEEKQTMKSFEDEIYRNKIVQNYKDCEIENLLDILVTDAKSKGANGIISLKIDREEVTNNGLLQVVVRVSGLAINKE